MNNYETEVYEAIVAGERALDSLYRAKEELDSARGWGVFDILGGGLLTDLIKHSKMDKAESYMRDAKEKLTIFSRELGDIDEKVSFDFNSRDFIHFADFFCDGIISALSTQDRINSARNQVQRAIDKVDGILSKIR